MKFLNSLKSKLGICNHEWEDVDKSQVDVYVVDYWGERLENPVSYRVVILQRCKKCGKYRTYKYYL